MDFLFGAEMPLAVRFFFAFIIVLGLIGGTAYLVRRFGSDRLGSASARGRQPRLAVIDAAAVDGRRRLILIRRDNVEHLLMIGGPTDVVVEANIVRAAAAAREAQQPRSPAAPADSLPRPVPLGEANMWPLQPQPEPASPAVPRTRSPIAEEPAWPIEPEVPPLPPRQARPEPRPADPLAGLAAELSRQPALAEPPRQRQRDSSRREPAAERPRPSPQAAPDREEPFASAADQNLAEMAQRLEAALRRPKSAGAGQPGRSAEPATTPATAAAPADETPPRTDGTPQTAAAARTDSKSMPQKSVYDSLEQEMASLLGRPNSKT